MGNTYFSFRHFTIHQEGAAMKVCTDACLFGAWVVQKEQDLNQGANILDIGTGTGLLSIMMAQKTGGNIRAIEIDQAAAMQAMDNVKRSSWAERIEIIHVSVQDYVPAELFQVIISNPPFFEQDLLSPDKRKNTAKHSGQMSFDFLAGAIAKWLDSNGRAYILIPYHRFEALQAETAYRGLLILDVMHVRQTPRHGFFRSMVCVGRKEVDNTAVREMSIRDVSGQYSELFRNLLSDYYLYL